MTVLNEEQLKTWILRRLGAPQRTVELMDENLFDAIEEARRWFSAKKGVRRQIAMPVVSGETEYALPEDADVILDVAFSLAPFDFAMVFSPFLLHDEKVPYNVFAAPQSVGVYSTFTQSLQYIEMAKRVLSAEADWRQEGRKLMISPVPKDSRTMIVDYKSGKVTIEQLGERDHDMVKRYALAYAKLDLGRIRSKYNSYPTAQGNVDLDGARLLDEATREIALLDEELALSAFPMGFLFG